MPTRECAEVGLISRKTVMKEKGFLLFYLGPTATGLLLCR